MASKKIPCGGFSYDDNDFEFITPMGGGIPTLKSKGGSGTVPKEVENAVETHGMGWTDEEEIPAINITWDGDTEGKVKLEDLYKVSDSTYSLDELIGATLSSTFTGHEEIELTSENTAQAEGIIFIYVSINGENINYAVCVSENTAFEAGLYFYKNNNSYVTSLTKEASTQEVVYKIDEKYIPSSGGAVVVRFTTEDVLEADMTVNEVLNAMLSSVVVGVINEGGVEMPLGVASAIFKGSSVDVGFMVDIYDGERIYQIYSEDGVWKIFEG